MKPVKITRNTLAAVAAQRWDLQYPPAEASAARAAISLRLHHLGENPNPDDVDRVIGNRYWTDPPRCGGCDRTDLDEVVRVGEEPVFEESATAYLCRGCLLEAVALCLSEDNDEELTLDDL